MTAGSGPYAIPLSAVAVGTAETIIATFPASNWNNANGLGNLVEFSGFFTPPATAGSLVLRLRQGTTVAGTQVGPTITQAYAASTGAPCGVEAVDASAFGNAQQGGQYVLTGTYAAAAGGTITGVVSLETCAPLN